MGTSGSTSGSGSDTPLVPSWLDEPGAGPVPGDNGESPPDDETSNENPNGLEDGKDGEFWSTKLEIGQRFRSARANFSRFAGSGGSDRRALRRAVRDYVRKGTGGSKNAVRRMAPSRVTAGRALGVLRSLQRDGIQETLRYLNLQSLSGGSVQEIFTGLTEVVCQDGGSIDEAIARAAWLETIAELDHFGITDVDDLTEEHVKELFLSFVAHSIETRLYQEIGVNGFKLCTGLDDIEKFDRQFREYIRRSVYDSFSSDISWLSDLSDGEIRRVVDTTYREGWELLEKLGDREG